MTKAKKLPKVWVYFRNGRVMTADLMKNRPLPDETVHQYAPVQKPRRCVWTAEEEFMRGACDRSALYPYGFNYVFCPLCKGKIEVKR